MKAHYKLVRIEDIKFGQIIYIKGIGRVIFRGLDPANNRKVRNGIVLSSIYYSTSIRLSSEQIFIQGIYIPVLKYIVTPCSCYSIHHLIFGGKYHTLKLILLKPYFRRTTK